MNSTCTLLPVKKKRRKSKHPVEPIPLSSTIVTTSEGVCDWSYSCLNIGFDVKKGMQDIKLKQV